MSNRESVSHFRFTVIISINEITEILHCSCNLVIVSIIIRHKTTIVSSRYVLIFPSQVIIPICFVVNNIR